MDKEFAEEFGLETTLKEEDKMEVLANAIAGLSELPQFKEDSEAIMGFAETTLESGFPPDPMELAMVDSKTKDAVIHLIAKKMGVKWTAQMGYGEMRMKQNYPESTDMVMKLLGKKKGNIQEDKDLEKIVKELEGASKMHLGQSKRIAKYLETIKDKKEEVEVEEGVTGPTRMDVQKHFDKEKGLLRARINATEKALKISDMKVDAKGTVQSFKEEVEVDEASRPKEMSDDQKMKVYNSLKRKDYVDIYSLPTKTTAPVTKSVWRKYWVDKVSPKEIVLVGVGLAESVKYFLRNKSGQILFHWETSSDKGVNKIVAIKKGVQEEVEVDESGHTDVASAKTQVKVAKSALQKMEMELSKLPDEGSLPSWWTNKVAIAVDKLLILVK